MLIHLGVQFPYVHDLVQLLTLAIQADQTIPESVKQAAKLSDYAVETRYPGPAEPVTLAEYKQAVAVAEDVLRWAEDIITQQ